MSIGARKNNGFKAVCTAPSVNKTPVGSSTPPIPYPVAQDLGNSQNVVSNVLFNSDPAYVFDQTTQPSCTGDAAGSCHGVKSGTISGEVKPVQGATHTLAGGKPVIRHGDPCTMNGGNCPGIYVTSQVPTPTAGGNNTPGTPAPIRPETPAEQGFLASAGTAGAALGSYRHSGQLIAMAGAAAGLGKAPHPAAGFVPGKKGA
jgi:hypothetical protein